MIANVMAMASMKKYLVLVILIFLIIPVYAAKMSYKDYLDYYNSARQNSDYEEKIDINSFLGDRDTAADDFFVKDKNAITLPSKGGSWKISVPESGFYTFYFEYLFYPQNGSEKLTLLVDEGLPFKESESILPTRYYRNAAKDRDKPTRNATVAPLPGIIWQKRYAGDTSGRSDYPLKYYLTKGEHEITLLPEGGIWYLAEFIIASYAPPPTVEEYRRQNPVQYTAGIDTVITLDGAYYTYQYGEADAMVYMDLEADPKRNYNAVGRWRYPGNGLIWEFEVEEEGFYEVAFRYALGDLPLLEIPLGRLSYKGFNHSERLFLLDGKIPFKEAELFFFYPTDSGKKMFTNYWYLYSPQFSLPDYTVNLELFLTRGSHTIELAPNLKSRLPVIELLDKLQAQIVSIESDFKLALGEDPNPNLYYNLQKETKDQLKSLLADVTLGKRKVTNFSRGSQVESSLNDILNRVLNLALLEKINTGDMVEITRIKDNLQRTISIAHYMPLNLDAILLYSPRNTGIKPNFRNESLWGKLRNYMRYRVKI